MRKILHPAFLYGLGFVSALLSIYTSLLENPPDLEDYFGMLPQATVPPQHEPGLSVPAFVGPSNQTNNGMIEVDLPPHIQFEIQDEEQHALHTFLRSCTGTRKRSRDSPVNGMFEWQTNPACRKVAEIPSILNAVRRVLGLLPDSPLWLIGARLIEKKRGDTHRLHSDAEFRVPECRPLASSSAWILIDRECPKDPSPLTLLSGSHLLATTAHDELASRNCWSLANQEPRPCNVTTVLEQVQAKYPYTKIVKGPTKDSSGIAWPSTAWHMTRDTCLRRALVIKYAASLSCAEEHRHVYPTQDVGQFIHLPDKSPYLRVGQSKTSNNATEEEERNPMFRLQKQSFEGDERCQIPPPPTHKQIAGARLVVNRTYVSGQYAVNPGAMEHIGYSMKAPDWQIRSERFLVRPIRTHYSSDKKQNLAHKPHLESTLEICTLIQGRINYAMSTSCHEPYDVMSMSVGKVALLFPGIFHTASPDSKVDGEHMCFKIIPLSLYKGNYTEQAWDKFAVDISRVASRSLDVDFSTFKNRSLEIFHVQNGQNRMAIQKTGEQMLKLPPGYQRLHVKLVHYQTGEVMKTHVDKYDLIALAVSGELHIVDFQNATVPLPEHQFAFVPAGVPHGFVAPYGQVVVLFIEIG